ncbi:GNAT family N-acetyltransferase [Sutcliffiella horikoshii]|uniref:GNAT family N-acetyltransferase n=1 Tax=Sutcliffiella horikoshii TaxID=79883 RepID=UPI003CE79F5E
MVNLKKVNQDQEAVLHNIIQFYIYEFTRFNKQITLETDGKYKPFDLDKYWKENEYHAFFIISGEELAGFALVEEGHEGSPNVIEEFFVLRKFHGKGMGTIASQQLFSMFPGKWQIFQIENNYPAQAFWRKTIKEYTSNTFTERYDEYRRSIQEFDTATLPIN